MRLLGLEACAKGCGRERKGVCAWKVCVVKLKQKGWEKFGWQRTEAHWSACATLRSSESALPTTTPPFIHQEGTPNLETMSTETTPTTENVEIYRQLEEYPWDTDKEFQVRWLGSASSIHDQPRHLPSKQQHCNITLLQS